VINIEGEKNTGPRCVKHHTPGKQPPKITRDIHNTAKALNHRNIQTFSHSNVHAVGYLPFSEFWRLFSNCDSRKLLRTLCGFGAFYTGANNGDNAKKVPIASVDGWKRVKTRAKNNDASLNDAVKTLFY
jgi:hypothetical protein